MQNKKLHDYINNYLYPFSRHYQELFDQHGINPKKIKTVADLKTIPFSSKQSFADPQRPEKFKDFVLRPDKEKIRKHWPASKLLKLKSTALIRGSEYVTEQLEQEFSPVFITYTTGTTAKPISTIYTKYDINNLSVFGSRMIELFDMKRSDYLLNMFPYAPHLAFWQVVFGGLSSAVLILSTGGGKVMGTGGNIAAIEKMQPSVIIGVPSYVYHVLRIAKEKGCRMESVKKVVLGASRITVPFKEKLAETLESMGASNVSVFGTYGFTEARSAWAECPTTNDVSSGYHLYPDKEIFEIIDPDTGEVKGEGEDGELVYTSIDARGSVVLRYRTGDIVKGGISYEPCPYCHRTVPRISSDITRISNVKNVQISKIKGSLVNLNNFYVVLSEFKEVEEWQVELFKKDNDPFEIDQLVVYISSREGINQSVLAEDIQKQLLVATEISPNEVKFISLEEMVSRLELETANKEKRIVDRRQEL